MDCCPDYEEMLLTYLDKEAGDEAKKIVERHLEQCPACRAWADKSLNLDQLLIMSAPQIEDEELFLRQVSGNLPEKRIFRKSLAALLTAAAVLLLLWTYTILPQPQNPHEKVIAKKDPNLIQARMELSQILSHLSDTPDEDLLAAFEEKTQVLVKKGWRVKNMVSSALKREAGESLLTAIRLAVIIPQFKRIIGAVPALITLQNRGVYPKETLNALAVLDGPQAEDALGQSLFDPEVQVLALEHLNKIDNKSAAEKITQYLLSDHSNIKDELSPFDMECIEALLFMKEWGVDSIVHVFNSSNQNPAIVRALSPPDPAWTKALIKKLPKMKGSEFDAGINLASFLRITDTIEILNNRAKRSRMEKKYPELLARIGGERVILNLVELYEGPVSKRERKGLAAALSSVFDLYPEEMDYSLTMVVLFSEEGLQETLVEMLSKGQGQGACKALAWIIKNSEGYAFSAAMALAKIGSEEALNEANALINNNELDTLPRSFANAAVLYINQQKNTNKSRRRLTETRFAKLQESFLENQNP